MLLERGIVCGSEVLNSRLTNIWQFVSPGFLATRTTIKPNHDQLMNHFAQHRNISRRHPTALMKIRHNCTPDPPIRPLQ